MTSSPANNENSLYDDSAPADFISLREQERTLTRAAAAASAPVFAAIWNNPDDDAYDAL
jgi:hypothetical protein